MENNPFSLIGKTVIITGASSGIGRQCAISCSRMGAKIGLFGRNRSRLEETLRQMENKDSHTLYEADLLEFEKIAGIVSGMVERMGKINGLVHCAGISTTLPLNAMSISKMEYYFKINVLGAINLTKQIIKPSAFSNEGGSVIFLSSVMGVAGEKGKTLYSMTKGALIAAVHSLALEFSHKEIRINAVSPGVVVSPMSKKAVYSKDEKSINRISELHPLGLGKTADIANACVFLLSDASRWITGTNLIVDGGYLAK